MTNNQSFIRDVPPSGKPIKDSEGVTCRLIDTMRIAAEESVRMAGEVQPLDISPPAKRLFQYLLEIAMLAVANSVPWLYLIDCGPDAGEHFRCSARFRFQIMATYRLTNEHCSYRSQNCEIGL